MTEENKSITDQLADSVNQLKEMRHYSKTNVEHLTAMWMLFDGELASLKRIEKIDDLMGRQGRFYDALESTIGDLEAILQERKEKEAAAAQPSE